MHRTTIATLAGALILLSTAASEARSQTTGGRLHVSRPGPLTAALYSPAANGKPIVDDRVFPPADPGSPVPLQGAVLEEPPLWQSIVYGIGAKILVDGLLIDFAGDTFHALPSLLFIDPVVTAAGVHIGNETRGSFFLDLLSSYGTLYLFTTLFYGEFMPAGQFEDPTSYGDFWTSVGIQFVSVVVTERLTARAASARKRR